MPPLWCCSRLVKRVGGAWPSHLSQPCSKLHVLYSTATCFAVHGKGRFVLWIAPLARPTAQVNMTSDNGTALDLANGSVRRCFDWQPEDPGDLLADALSTITTHVVNISRSAVVLSCSDCSHQHTQGSDHCPAAPGTALTRDSMAPIGKDPCFEALLGRCKKGHSMTPVVWASAEGGGALLAGSLLVCPCRTRGSAELYEPSAGEGCSPGEV